MQGRGPSGFGNGREWDFGLAVDVSERRGIRIAFALALLRSFIIYQTDPARLRNSSCKKRSPGPPPPPAPPTSAQGS